RTVAPRPAHAQVAPARCFRTEDVEAGFQGSRCRREARRERACRALRPGVDALTQTARACRPVALPEGFRFTITDWGVEMHNARMQRRWAIPVALVALALSAVAGASAASTNTYTA